MKDEIFNDLMPTHVLKEMENNMKEDAPEITEAWVETATISCGTEYVRKQFEEFARNHPHLSHVRMKRNKLNQDIYFDRVMQTAWETWQASREELVIELPTQITDLSDIKNCLVQQGVNMSDKQMKYTIVYKEKEQKYEMNGVLADFVGTILKRLLRSTVYMCGIQSPTS